MDGDVLLAVTNVSGVQVWKAEGSKMLFWHPLVEGSGASFMRGACVCRGGSGALAMITGTSTGELYWYPKAASSSSVFAFSEGFGAGGDWHRGAVMDIAAAASSAGVFASCDEAGTVLVWASSGKAVPTVTFRADHPGCAATSVRVSGDSVCVAFSTGHIRLFSLSTRSLSVEVCAHSRWINALDVNPQGLLASAAEDTFVNVWRLPSAPGAQDFSLVASHSIPDRLLFGVAFNERNEIAAIPYDSEAIAILKPQ